PLDAAPVDVGGAEDVRGEPDRRVEALRLEGEADAGEVERAQPPRLLGLDVPLQPLEVPARGGPGLDLAHVEAPRLRARRGAAGDVRDLARVDEGGRNVDGERELDAVRVVDRSARRGQDELLQVLLLAERAEARAVAELERAGLSDERDEENGEDDGGQR